MYANCSPVLLAMALNIILDAVIKQAEIIKQS
jgi:hypothetical protein